MTATHLARLGVDLFPLPAAVMRSDMTPPIALPRPGSEPGVQRDGDATATPMRGTLSPASS